jgi:hypothetical protein
MIQPHLLICLIPNFGEVKNRRKFLTPDTPTFKIRNSITQMDLLDVDHQRKYRSGVDMLLYLTKYSCPGIGTFELYGISNLVHLQQAFAFY